MSMSDSQKAALDTLIAQAEKAGDTQLGSPPGAAAWPALALEATVMITATVAGRCAVPDDVVAERDELVKKLKSVTTLEELKALRDS